MSSETSMMFDVNDENAWLFTHSGRRLYFLNPQADQIDLNDIAIALSRVNRFNGHTDVSYSVGQHSVMAAKEVLRRHGSSREAVRMALAALLHDASEAYICDIPKPLKPFIMGYADIEDRLMQVIFERFGLSDMWPMNADLKAIDADLLVSEMRLLMPNNPNVDDVLGDEQGVVDLMEPTHADIIRQHFVYMFDHLSKLAA